MRVDAIVNAANPSLLGGGGVDGAIHRAAGPALLEECSRLGGCETGDAKITGAGRLPCRWVNHTVGPVWRGGGCGEPALLAGCYRRSLELAAAQGCRTVAFPLISAGAYGYPQAAALQVAVETIAAALADQDRRGEEEMTVWLVIFDRDAYRAGLARGAEIAAYIDDRYVQTHGDPYRARRARMARYPEEQEDWIEAPSRAECFEAAPAAPAAPQPAAAPFTLDEALAQLDESFSQMVLRKIDELGIKDSECYKRANLDRKLFSKLRKNPAYHPAKTTALSLAVALRLTLPETRDLLQKAGYALSRADKGDVIVEYFILHGIYDIFEINETLFAFDQYQLGV